MLSIAACQTGPRRANRQALTLVELLVVIGIICFILALLLPAVQTSCGDGRRSQCTNNLKQIGLGLQNYGDVFKCLPADAIWGDGSGELPQPPYHHPWTVAILPFIEQRPLYDAINKQIPIMADADNPAEFTGQISSATPPAYGNSGLPLLHSQQIPAFRCPSDNAFNGPGDLPMTMMWTNYAASEGVGYYPAELVESEARQLKSAAPKDHKGMFPFAEWTTFAAVRDGTSNTIAVAEVTAGSVSNQLDPRDRDITRQTTPIVSYTGVIPNPLDWSVGKAQGPAGFPLKGGTGRPRLSLFTSRSHDARAPLVFRSLWVALTNSGTGGAPCAGGDFYRGALGGPCGGDDGFELHSAAGASPPIYGVAPTYNALYPPNSDWPGPDSAHPGAIIAVFADGHTQTIQQNIDYRIWASLNTRAGSETINGEF